MGKLNGWKTACAVFLVSAGTAITVFAQTFTTLRSFDLTDGSEPFAGLVQATDGNLYGTTKGGGPNSCTVGSKVYGCGTVFKITPGGTLKTLYSFCSQSGCADGWLPVAGLVQGTDGNLYGMTFLGGTNLSGTVFKIIPGGTLTTLYTFCSQIGCMDGANPSGALVQDTNGNLYGTTTDGGSFSAGTVFKISPSGVLTTLHSFEGSIDGANPVEGLVQAADGNLYGTTQAGGVNGVGTVLKITPSGKLTTLYSFCSLSGCADGEYPYAGLVQATDGNLYGTTTAGGASGYAGTIFEVTPAGRLKTLYSFCSQSGCADGSVPVSGLVQGTDGNFYGTASSGGATGDGTAFIVSPSGTLTTLYNFCSQSGCADGAVPEATLVQDTNGSFYGATFEGGASGTCLNGCGTVFRLSVGLGPFVETRPTSGKVGVPVKILGTNLTGATSVTFNGTAAVFTVVSSSEITTTVPTGASSGRVRVVTPSGTLSSNVKFRVAP